MRNITIYHKDYCPYCRAALHMLDAAGLQYQAIEVTHDPAAFTEMVARSGRRTVPQIFFAGRHIGGYDDLQEYARRHGGLPASNSAIAEVAA